MAGTHSSRQLLRTLQGEQRCNVITGSLESVAREKSVIYLSTMLPYDRYCIRNKKKEMRRVAQSVVASVINQDPIHLVQQLPEIAPIVVDLNLVYRAKYPDRQYDLEWIDRVVGCYTDSVREYLEFTPAELAIYVYQKPEPDLCPGETTTRDGIHFIYPFLHAEPSVQMAIRDAAIANMEKADLFRGMKLAHKRVSQIISSDPIAYRSWLVPGASMGPQTGGYQVSRLYFSPKPFQLKARRVRAKKLQDPQFLEDLLADLTIAPDAEPTELVSGISLRKLRASFPDPKLALESSDDSVDDTDSQSSDSEASTRSRSKKTKKKSKSKSKSKRRDDSESEDSETKAERRLAVYQSVAKREQKRREETKDQFDYTGQLLPVEEVSRLLDLVSDRRAQNLHDWRNVGMDLMARDKYETIQSSDYCRDPPGTLFRGVWLRFNKRSNGMFDKRTALKYWNSLARDTNIYPAWSCVIVWMARQDSERKYLGFEQTKLDLLGIDRDPNINNEMVVNILRVLIGDQYICTGDNKYGWYRFLEHRWVSNITGHDLYVDIGRKVKPVINQIRMKLVQESCTGIGSTTKRGAAGYTAAIGELNKSEAKLGTDAFRNSTMSMASKMFTRDNLHQQLDRHFNLLCFENGVMDLDTMTLRSGYPSDMITLSTLIDYVEYDPEDPNIQAVNALVDKIMVDRKMRDYLYSVIASCLMGGNHESNIFFFIGHGGNGKSVFMKLVKAAFGNYLKDMNSKTLVNGKTDGAAASPDIAMTKGAHILAFEEIGENEKIDINMLKRLSGGTDLTARYLFQQNFEFTPMFTMFLVMNELFDLKTFNHAIIRRFKIIEFKSKFWTRSAYRETGRSEDDMQDNEFWEEDMRTIPKEWGTAFMSIIMHHYRKYRKTGHLKHPEQVLRSTKDYLHTKDYFYGFIKNHLIATGDEDDFIEMANFLKELRIWNTRVRGDKTGVISQESAIRYFQTHPEYTFDPKTYRLHGYALPIAGEDVFDV